MHEHVVLKVVVRLLLPFIMMFAFYIQFHGEYSPGGGFQSGVILAAGFIVYSFVYDLERLKGLISNLCLRICAAVGVLIYASVGVISMAKGGKFLDYSVLMVERLQGQHLGVMLVEIGVGITVFSVVMLIFYSFGERAGDDN